MKKTKQSLGFALTGLTHAIQSERNIRLFLIAHLVIVGLGYFFGLSVFEWIAIILFAVLFLITELINTSIERLADTFDDCEKKRNAGHYHAGIKQAKDVAAAASLLAFGLDCIVLLLIFVPLVLWL